MQQRTARCSKVWSPHGELKAATCASFLSDRGRLPVPHAHACLPAVARVELPPLDGSWDGSRDYGDTRAVSRASKAVCLNMSATASAVVALVRTWQFALAVCKFQSGCSNPLL